MSTLVTKKDFKSLCSLESSSGRGAAKKGKADDDEGPYVIMSHHHQEVNCTQRVYKPQVSLKIKPLFLF